MSLTSGAVARRPTLASPFATVICDETSRECVRRYGSRLRAIVLTGSLARDEGTFVRERGGVRLLGDAKFLLVFHEGAPCPAVNELQAVERSIERAVAARHVEGPVGLSAGRSAYLRRMRPHIFTNELRYCSHIVWGDPVILSLIPHFPVSAIPLEAAWRLLADRLVEQLEAIHQFTSGALSPEALHYQAVKLYLDMATSLLVFAGAYEPTYRARAVRLAKLAGRARLPVAAPFDLEEFAQRVAECTEWKVNASALGHRSVGSARGRELAFWQEAVADAERLWHWELARLTGRPAEESTQQLLSAWTHREPFHRRLRGWLHVLRREGWHRSWREWPRWARRTWRESPRYAVYATVADVLFGLPATLAGESRRAAEGEQLRRLPVIGKSPGQPTGWQRLAAEIAWNYHRFLAETRA